jgi:hypothetical protein
MNVNQASSTGPSEPADGSGADAPLDPRAALALYTADKAEARTRSARLGRITYIAWGLAWIVGYGALYVSARQTGARPAAWAFAVLAVVLACAITISTVVGVRSNTQIVGPSAKSGAFFGWSFAIAFVGGMQMAALIASRYGLSPEAADVLYNCLPALLVGTLYMSSAAVWKSTPMFVTGVIFVVMAVAGSLAGVPDGYLVMSLLGGGLLLLAGLVDAITASRRKARATP